MIRSQRLGVTEFITTDTAAKPTTTQIAQSAVSYQLGNIISALIRTTPAKPQRTSAWTTCSDAHCWWKFPRKLPAHRQMTPRDSKRQSKLKQHDNNGRETIDDCGCGGHIAIPVSWCRSTCGPCTKEGELPFVTDHLDIVPVGTYDKRCIVTTAVFGSDARGAIVCCTGF